MSREKKRKPFDIQTSLELTLKRKYIYLVLFCVLGFGAYVGVDRLGPILHSLINDTEAITTPWGVIYFVEPYPEIVAHEQCHVEELERVGVVNFYSNYFTGGACEEEKRCGYYASPVCEVSFDNFPLNTISSLSE